MKKGFYMKNLYSLLRSKVYPGRGIALGTTPSGKAVAIYFIMGRSASSRARRFEMNGDDLVIKYISDNDPAHAELIVYSPVRVLGNKTIVTNGDQTDTICEGLRLGGSFESALATRCFEPDPPHYTARISGLITLEDGQPSYKLSVLKAGDDEGKTCVRQFFDYEKQPGVGHFIHTYMGGSEKLITFAGEPIEVKIPEAPAYKLGMKLWDCLNYENKVALHVRVTDPETGKYEWCIYNKYV